MITPRWSLPAPLTPLVGREREIAQAAELLRTARVRLLTLSGPGGVGKTRLALLLAEEVAGDFPGGVVFVPLAPLDDPEEVPAAIAGTLGLPDMGDVPLLDSLTAVLDAQPKLLVLDNFEQLVEAGPVVTALLSACPALKIVVTSRTVLHVTGEHELVVPPLPVPGLARSRSIAEIAESDAVTLFVVRAGAVNPDFALTEENAPAIVEICRRVDGLPLAIELAAARTKVLSPRALAERLSDRLQVLIGGPRDQPARLQTMRNAIAWSYDLLDPDEQRLFRRLAVFPAGFSLDAAESVGDAPLVLDGITSLVDKSLLQQATGPDGEPRFTMLETIRAFALEQLAASGEEADTRQRHADWCGTLVTAAAATLHAVPNLAALNRLEHEHDSLRAALGWLLDTGETEQAAQMVVDAWWFWFTHSHLAVGRAWSARALDQLGDVPTLLWLRLMNVTGWFAESTGEFETAVALHERALAVARELGDPGSLGIALYALADTVNEERDPNRSLALFHEAETIFRGLDATPWLAVTLNTTGAIYRESGALDRAVALIEEGLTLARERNHPWLVALSLGHLARVRRMQGDLTSALDLDRQAVRLWYELGDWWRLSRAMNELGIAAQFAGQHAYAARLLGGSEALREQIGGAFMPLLTSAYEQALVGLHHQLSDEEFTAAWDAGRAMTLDELLDLSAMPPAAPARAKARVSDNAGLSTREMEVLRLLVAGHSDRQIAETLYISHRTAQGHVGSIFNKLGVNSRTAAATTAIRLGLVSDAEDR